MFRADRALGLGLLVFPKLIGHKLPLHHLLIGEAVPGAQEAGFAATEAREAVVAVGCGEENHEAEAAGEDELVQSHTNYRQILDAPHCIQEGALVHFQDL